jgi:A nuclease family of the HNH/ENDO VII superfamily with conserved AHH
MVRKLGLGYRGARGCGRVAVNLRLLIVVSVVLAACTGGMIESAHAAATTSAKTQGSQVQARAAFVPLAAIMVCSRVCPVAGVAAARIIRRAPKQIKPIRTPNLAAAKAFSSAAGSSPSRALGIELAETAERAAFLRAAGLNAHHIVAVKDARAEFARMVLALRGIGPNSAANGVWLPRVVHAPIHTNAYYANVNMVMASTISARSGRRRSWSTTWPASASF